MAENCCLPCRRRYGPGFRGNTLQGGFTLVELVAVILVLGILAVVAVPRMISGQAYQARGFHDGTMSALRLAQKSAIAERRTVCVAFAATTVSLTMRSAAGDTACAYAVGPGEPGLGASGAAYTVRADGAVSYAAVPGNFSFSPLGQASAASTIRIAGEDDINVVAETGYVHSP